MKEFEKVLLVNKLISFVNKTVAPRQLKIYRGDDGRELMLLVDADNKTLEEIKENTSIDEKISILASLAQDSTYGNNEKEEGLFEDLITYINGEEHLELEVKLYHPEDKTLPPLYAILSRENKEIEDSFTYSDFSHIDNIKLLCDMLC